MADSVDKFARELELEFDAILQKDFLALKHRVALEILSGVTQKMPVDTGRARANTTVSVGREDFKYTDETENIAVAKGATTLATDKNPYAKIFVQNNLPYIERLENGHSKQAPEGMFALTVDEIEAKFK